MMNPCVHSQTKEYPLPVRRASVRGNAMLELVLILPMYMLLLFIVITMGEYGQMATQLYQTARATSWKMTRNDSYPHTEDTRGSVQGHYFTHFGPRAKAKTGDRTFVPLQLSGVESSGQSVSACGVAVVRGSSNYSIAPTLANPLPPATEKYLAQIETDRPRPNMMDLSELALDGDLQASHAIAVPWVRRHYASVVTDYKPIDGIVPAATFRTLHTVLRAETWPTSIYAPYDLGSKPSWLRDVEAYPTADGTIARPSTKNHQMDLLNTPVHLEPDWPE